MKKRGKINPAITPLLIGFLLIIIALILVKPGLTGNAISPTTLNNNIIKLDLTIKDFKMRVN